VRGLRFSATKTTTTTKKKYVVLQSTSSEIDIKSSNRYTSCRHPVETLLYVISSLLNRFTLPLAVLITPASINQPLLVRSRIRLSSFAALFFVDRRANEAAG
jgi:hypothetical protein